MVPTDRGSHEAASDRFNGLTTAILGGVEVALFEQLYVAHKDEARRLAAAITSDASLAEDAVQAAFLEILKYLLAGRRWYALETARSVVLRNTRWAALKALRTRRSDIETARVDAAGHARDDAEWARAEARALCEQVVRRLRPEYRAVLRERFVENHPNARAARTLGLSLTAYETRLSRALKEARRDARGLGITAVATTILAAGDRARRQCSAVRRLQVQRCTVLAAKLGVSAGLMLVVAHAAAAGLPPAVPRAASPQMPQALVANLVASSAEPLRDEAIGDMVVSRVSTRQHGESFTMIVDGYGKECGCPVALGSQDGGRSWLVGPTAGDGGSAVVEVPSTTCVTGAGGVVCLGRIVRGLAASEEIRPGSVARLPTGVLIYRIPTGGILCSADGGASWGPRCS
jgi:RNA polymerase sigma factor (sigma-70 family)